MSYETYFTRTVRLDNGELGHNPKRHRLLSGRPRLPPVKEHVRVGRAADFEEHSQKIAAPRIGEVVDLVGGHWAE